MIKNLGYVYLLVFSVCQVCFLVLINSFQGYSRAHMRRIRDICTGEMLMLLGSFLIWKRSNLLLKTIISQRQFLRDCIAGALLVFIVSSHICWGLYYILVSPEPHWFALFTFVCCGFFIYLAALLIGCSLVKFTAELLENYSIGRRILAPFVQFRWLKELIFNANIQTVACIGLTLLLTCIGLHHAYIGPVVNPVSITLDRLPKDLDGFRVVHLTDLHIGPTVGRRHVEQVVDIVNRLDADVVSIAGDLVDGDVTYLANAAAPLKFLRSKYGVFYSTGNHEYYHGHIDSWFDYFRQLNIQVLHNQHHFIRSSAASSTGICLAGVDDASSESTGVVGHGLDIDAALKGCDENANAVIVLCHQPRGARRIINSNHTVDLVLAGHTHGGQFLVVIPPALLTNPYFLGLYKHPKGTQVYVSAGVYFWGPPVKNTGLEISLLTLKRSNRL